jgi:hypothetical protein
VPAEGQKAGLVALDQRLEGGLLALAAEGYKPLVALEPEQGRPSGKCRKGSAWL